MALCVNCVGEGEAEAEVAYHADLGETHETKRMAREWTLHEVVENCDGDKKRPEVGRSSVEDLDDDCHSDWQAVLYFCPCLVHASYRTLVVGPSLFVRELFPYRLEQRKPSLHAGNNHLWILASSQG